MPPNHFQHNAQQLVGNASRIVLLVLEGLAGSPVESSGLTEWEAARTPNLDALALAGNSGLHVPVAAGITPGSGPGHLGIFGHDPLSFNVGRGALSAALIDFDLRPSDVAARGNFCTLDDAGNVTDRRAGRIETKTNERLCEKLSQTKFEGVEVFVQTVNELRFLLVLRWSKTCRPDGVRKLGERPCLTGSLGPRFPATDLMPLALARAWRLRKYGA